MSIAKKIGVALLVVGSVGVAYADQVPGSFYAGGSLGSSITKLDKDTKAELKAEHATTDLNDIGVKAFAGYNIDKSWSVEGGFAYLGKPSATRKAGSVTETLANSLAALYVAGVYSYPVADRVSVFGKAGLSINRSADKVTEVNGTSVSSITENSAKLRPMLGVGLSYDIDKQFAVRTEFEYFGRMGKDSDSKTSFLSVGVVYKF